MFQLKILLWRWERASIGKGKRVSGTAVSCPKLPVILSLAEPTAGQSRLRRVLREPVQEVLSPEAGPSVARAGHVLPFDADRLF